MRTFKQEMQDFAELFVDLQDKRHQADYDPAWIGFKSDVDDHIVDARSVLDKFQTVPVQERRAFAAHVLFRSRD